MTGDSAPRQLPLDLVHAPALGRDDFLVGGCNEAALALVDRWPDWPSRVAVIIGPADAGKSHLAAIWAMATGASVVAARELTPAAVVALPEMPALVVEDIDDPALDEVALFHLMNLARERGTWLLLTSRVAPTALSPRIADLGSRLRAATPVELSEPDDDFLRRLLVKLLADRQLAVEPAVVDYIVLRMERSPDAASRIVARLDSEALAARRRITRPMAADVLRALGASGAGDD
ncbi:MAG: hypothetical protein R3D02_06100 [Hyphomicrobiales bacterium]